MIYLFFVVQNKIVKFTCTYCGEEFEPEKETTHNEHNWSAWKRPILCPHCGADNTVDFLLVITAHEEENG